MTSAGRQTSVLVSECERDDKHEVAYIELISITDNFANTL